MSDPQPQYHYHRHSYGVGRFLGNAVLWIWAIILFWIAVCFAFAFPLVFLGFVAAFVLSATLLVGLVLAARRKETNRE